jgi:hypothetical protein
MLTLFVNTKILLSLSLLLFVNIIMSNCPLFGLHMKMKQIFIYLPFDIGDHKCELHYCVGVEGAYIHVHHFHEIEMLPTMRWHVQRLLQSCILNCVIGSLMQR